MIIICWLKELFRSLTGVGFYQDGIAMSGHDYVEIEEHENCKVTICKCKTCDKIDVSWSKQ